MELAATVAGADVFVFPSQTDTFALVLLEAMAWGVPVVASPVTGHIDVVVQGRTGYLDADLNKAVLRALQLGREECVRCAQQYTWHRSTETVASYLAPSAETGLPLTSLNLFYCDDRSAVLNKIRSHVAAFTATRTSAVTLWRTAVRIELHIQRALTDGAAAARSHTKHVKVSR